MKNKEKAYSIALASTFIILFLILVLPTVSASGGAGYPSDDKDLSDELSTEGKSIVTAAPNFTETRITNNTSYQDHPVIYGNTIVWRDGRNGNCDIYMYDLSTKKEKRITANPSASFLAFPAIYGNRIVWQDDRNGNSDIYMYDISTSTETRITTNELWQEDPAIYGNRIVWTDGRNGNYDIYMYDLSTSTEKQITTNASSQFSPAIYGNRIVWSDTRNYDTNGNWDIYMYDLSTSTETQITTNESDQFNPDIYGNRIVWFDWRNGNSDIYMYDLSTQKETRITTDGSKQWYPAIYGDRVVWEDYRNGNSDIYMYDLTTGQESHTTNISGQSNPAIYGDKFVWEDYRDGYSDIYMGTIITAPPAAAFSASPTSGTAPLNVSFIDNSTGIPTSWKWTFGDGTNSTQQNPTHKYSNAGNYTVKLTATNELGSNTTTKMDYIKVKPTKPVANFTSNITSGYAPLDVLFKDKSTGTPTSWKWTFGDGTNSTQQNPIHKYSNAGNYTVALTATNAAGSNATRKVNYIKVNPTTKPVANFTSNVTSGYAPLNVAFTDKSSDSPTSWNWSFGDGIYSTVQNPKHTYLKLGNYTVGLTATNELGSNTTKKVNYINVNATKPVANFTSNVTSGNAPLDVAFTDKSLGLPTAWNWTFGDGTNSTQQNPTHKYSNAGNYTVTLTASNSAGSNKITKSSYIKVKLVTRPVANFTSNVTSGYAPLNVSFKDKSTGIPTKWKWTFGDGINSTQQNPTHMYSNAGNYTVTLTASNSAGSNITTKPSYIKVNNP